MFVLSKTVISVLAFTVMLNVFYFDPTYSAETLTNFTSCNDCTAAPCHTTDNNTCIVQPDNSTYSCLTCNSTVDNGDTQFYSQTDCQASCWNQTACTCDGACYVCAAKSDPSTLAPCSPPTMMADSTCAQVPYVPQNSSAPTPPTSTSG